MAEKETKEQFEIVVGNSVQDIKDTVDAILQTAPTDDIVVNVYQCGKS